MAFQFFSEVFLLKRNKAARILAIILAVALALSLLLIPFAGMAHAEPMPQQESVTVLFTHDMHDHLLPVNTVNADGETVSSGGYARLKTLMDGIRAEKGTTITLDAGDYSMGSLFQSIYSTDAPELRMLGALGVDVTTFGNHEYDYGPDGLAQSLDSAHTSGDVLPQIVQANYKTPLDGDEAGEGARELVRALADYGVQDYTMIERNGLNIAVFGIMGKDSDNCAPNSEMALDDPIETARRVVSDIQENETADLIICLSHSGTDENEDKSEDHALAKAVPEIDLIISGHTHTLLEEAIQVGSTTIVSCGSYCENLGEVTLARNGDGWALADYTIHAVDDSVADDAAITEKIEGFKTIVEESYLSHYDLTFDEVLARNDIAFTMNEDGENTMGNLLADSYIYTVKLLEGENYTPITLSAVPDGVIRSTLATGELTTADAFNVLSLGIGEDRTIGYPLIDAYLTGKELSLVAEIDASVSRLLPIAKLSTSGITYTYNPSRIPLDYVTDLKVITESGNAVWPDNKQLYRVVSDLYTLQMLSSVTDVSYGLIKLTPKDENGEAITDLNSRILHDSEGNEIKAWQCVATYLRSFEKDGSGVSVVPAQYAQPEGRVVMENDSSLSAIVSNPGTTTLIVIVVLAVLIVLIGLVTHLIVRRWANKLDYHEIEYR